MVHDELLFDYPTATTARRKEGFDGYEVSREVRDGG